jgi:transcription antitermination factor NusG
MRELCPENELNWYALHVRYQHEVRTGRLLESKGWEILVPVYHDLRRWSDRVKEIDLPLFAGYVFCRFPRFDCRHVEDTPGAVRILRFGGHPAPIPQREIDGIQAMLAARVRLSPWPFLKAGDQVRVERGPLRGLEGTLLRNSDSSRLVVSVEMLQRSIAAEVDPCAVVPIRGRAANGGA